MLANMMFANYYSKTLTDGLLGLKLSIADATNTYYNKTYIDTTFLEIIILKHM